MTGWRPAAMNALHRFLRLGVLLAGAALLWSCVAPILTVPPPSSVSFESMVVTNADGSQQTVWIASGAALQQAANATYFVLDTTGGDGVIATAKNDGSFVAATPLVGNQGDHVLVYYKTPFGDYSDSTCVLLAVPPAGSSAALCPE
jgi:hypothetical protein